MKKIILFLFFVVIVFAEANAIGDTLSLENCEEMKLDLAFCHKIKAVSEKKNFNLVEQKEEILKYFSKGGITPQYDDVYNWNKNLIFDTSSPDNKAKANKLCTHIGSKRCIDNAWVSVFSIKPSFFEKNTLYINNNGSVQIGFNYNLSHPPDISAGGDRCQTYEPDTNIYGDCRSEFRHEDFSTLSVKQNNVYLINEYTLKNKNNNLFFPFETFSDENEFSAELNIINRVYKKYWKWEKGSVCGCARSCAFGGCCQYKYTWKCEYVGESYVDENIKIIDVFPFYIKKYSSDYTQNNILFSEEKGDIVGEIKTDADNYKLFIDNAELHQSKYKYKIIHNFNPYNVLSVERYLDKTFFSSMMKVEQVENKTLFSLFTDNNENCSLLLLEPFENKLHKCNVEKKAKTDIIIYLNNKQYDVNESIELGIDFKSSDNNESAILEIEYGDYINNISIEDKGTIKLNTIRGNNNVFVRFKGDDKRSSSENRINIFSTNTDKIFYFKIILILSIVFSLAYFLRRYMI